ncbi:MAG: sulfurtransferase complex subunit TusB [Pseudomonas sp.]|uniref:sulfurtransferase complex subunit TusB n=1 Tax=Pseudomonas abieticivorans TaxID=2931382 RepID=UPI0020BEDCCA|nr:sulfurtransferase complex subunit TusB [Pseudomonas sp. PIA16]MDE1165262.1 sulfurtransferase complex subunit TusB [Pseudomonas sp.]
MATLHVLSHSPFADNRLASCLRLLGDNDAILLTGDAVYALLPGTAPRQQLEGKKVFALDEDLQARAIDTDVPHVDYPGFVQLTLDYDKVNTWL